MKRPQNEIKCTFMSLSQNESLARSIVTGFMLPLDPAVDELADVRCAVSEAVTNCIVHAYPDTIGKVLLKCRIFDGGVVEITVRDYGVGIEDLELARTPMFTTGGDERSGMGFTIMESFTDSLRVKSKKGRGTTVIMKVRLASRVGRR